MIFSTRRTQILMSKEPTKRITPRDPMTYDWFNALQDEVCTPIEKTTKLSPGCNQLYTSIEHLISGSGMDLGEVTDYSGQPVPIPQLIVKPDEIHTLTLYLEIGLKAPIELSSLSNEDKQNAASYPFFVFAKNVEHLDFNDLRQLFSSNEILENRGDVLRELKLSDFTPIQIPEHLSHLQREDAICLLKKTSAKLLSLTPPAINSYVFGLTSDKSAGRLTQTLQSVFIDYSTISSLFSFCYSLQDQPVPNDYLKGIVSSFMDTVLMMRLTPPVVLATDPTGQVHYFYNKMMYGDTLRVRLGTFNHSKTSV